MDIGKLKGLSIGDLTARAQSLAEKLAPTDPDFASDLALALVKGVMSGKEDLSDIVGWFGEDADISGGLFPEEPVTVTKTTTSVGGLPPADLGDTPEEQAMIDNSEQLMNDILNAKDDSEIDAILAKNGLDTGNVPSEGLAGDTTPEEKEMLKQAAVNSVNGTEPKSEEPKKEDKPAEEPETKPEENKPEENKPEENKPEENKPEENKPKKENKPEAPKKEDKSSSEDNSDTQKNILKGLSNRF